MKESDIEKKLNEIFEMVKYNNLVLQKLEKIEDERIIKDQLRKIEISKYRRIIDE